eukprot:11457731-Alexandrium_andersonii.AAC.1
MKRRLGLEKHWALAQAASSEAPVSMEVGALEPEPTEGNVGPRQLQAAFELLRRAAYSPGKAS